jgi:predicted Zn-dependent protease
MKAATATILSAGSAVDSLKNRYLEQRDSERPGGRVSDVVARAENLAAQGDFEGSANFYTLAHSMSNNPLHELRADQMLTQFYAKTWEVWLEKGTREFAAGKFLEAANDLSKAQRGHPDDASICLRLADALRKAGETRRAITIADRAVMLAPESVVYREVLANLLLEAGLFLRAKREAETILSKAPSSETALSILCRAKKMAGTSS